MTQQNTNYDDVKQYRLDPEREQELVNCAGECTFCWANNCLLYTSPSPRDATLSRMPSSA